MFDERVIFYRQLYTTLNENSVSLFRDLLSKVTGIPIETGPRAINENSPVYFLNNPEKNLSVFEKRINMRDIQERLKIVADIVGDDTAKTNIPTVNYNGQQTPNPYYNKFDLFKMERSIARLFFGFSELFYDRHSNVLPLDQIVNATIRTRKDFRDQSIDRLINDSRLLPSNVEEVKRYTNVLLRKYGLTSLIFLTTQKKATKLNMEPFAKSFIKGAFGKVVNDVVQGTSKSMPMG